MSVRSAAFVMGLRACAAGHFGMPTEALLLAPGDGVEGSFSATGAWRPAHPERRDDAGRRDGLAFGVSLSWGD